MVVICGSQDAAAPSGSGLAARKASTLNDPLGKLGVGVGATEAVADLGGGSLQLAHALPPAAAAAAALEAGYVSVLSGGGRVG